MGLTASASVTTPSRTSRPTGTLSFNDIKRLPGLYVNVNTGNILIVGSKSGQLVTVPTSVTSSGKTRTGMLMYRKTRNGGFRLSHVKCGDGADGNRVWAKYTGNVTLGNNSR